MYFQPKNHSKTNTNYGLDDLISNFHVLKIVVNNKMF